MSKERARNPESYANEELLLAIIPTLLSEKGFVRVEVKRTGQMKFIIATGVEGGPVTFWLKQGWSDTKYHAAIQFGMLHGERPAERPDSAFVDFVLARVSSAKQNGASHALLVHMHDGAIKEYVALPIDDVATAYSAQIAGWPNRARATKMPTLFFHDQRDRPDAGYVDVVTELEVPLEQLANPHRAGEVLASGPAAKKITAEIELRMRQQIFRLRVGEYYGWKCPVSGATIREVLDAAHLPGKDWRLHNGAEDGVLLRADLHRLLDRGLASIRDGRFWVEKSARTGDYAQFHLRLVAP